MGVISDGMIFEESVDEFFFMNGANVVSDSQRSIAIVFPEEGNRAPVTLAWSGAGLDGEPLSNGAYIVKVESIDSLGITTVVTGSATILRAGSTVTVRVYNEAGEMVFTSQVQSLKLGQSDVQILGSVVDPSLSAGSPGSTLDVRLGTLDILWSGRDSNGDSLANGEYLVEVTLENGGETSVITETVTVLSSNEYRVAGIELSPNPVAGQGPVEIRAGSLTSVVIRIRAKVYTVSGELVRRVEAQSDSVLWDLKDVSGSQVTAGLYLVLVETSSADGQHSQALTRLVILR